MSISYLLLIVKRTLWLLLLIFTGVSVQSQQFVRGLQLLEKAEEYSSQKKWDSAYSLASRGLALFRAQRNDSLIAKSAISLLYITNFINAEKQDYYYRLAKEKAKKLNKPRLLAEVFYTKGKTLYENREMGSAQPYFLKVDSLSRKKNYVDETVVRALLARSEIQRTTFTHEGVEEAHKLQLEALEMARQIKSEKLTHDIYLRLADMKGLIGNYPEAKKYVDLALAYYKQQNNTDKMARAYLVYMNYYYAIHQYDEAGNMLKEGIAYLEKQNNPEQLASLLTAYGTFFRKRKNDCRNALVQFKKAQKVYDSIQLNLSDRYMYLMEGMALCHAELDDYKNAYLFYQKAYETKRELVKKANNELTRHLETKYQNERKNQQIALLAAQRQLSVQQQKNERFIYLGSLLLLATLLLVLFFQYKSRRKSNKRLEELNKAKSTFFANISHEFRTPLTLIKGPLEDWLARGNLPTHDRSTLTLALQSTQKLEGLVDHLLWLSKLESNNLSLQAQESNLTQFVMGVAQDFRGVCLDKNISYKIEMEKDEILDWFDSQIIERILENLLQYSIINTPENGNIRFEGLRETDGFKIKIAFTGKYISAKALTKIFDKYSSANGVLPNTEMGLSMAKQLIELHHGTIWMTSAKDGYTGLTLKFPTSKHNYSENELFSAEIGEGKKVIPLADFNRNNSPNASDAPILLVVDDNEDMCSYIKSIFSNICEVLCASDGKEGFDLALEQVPDIVISDVMMPKEDGFSLTRRLKQHAVTSHIPIILLTAKSEVTAKLEGMGIGADAYVTKPFNPPLLRATAANLIETRRKLQQRFAQENLLTPKELAFSCQDEKFLEQLQKTLDHHLTDPDFSTEEFAMAMNLSRMQLYRKLKALTGYTATEFIRTQRLKLALHTLKNKNLTISEVAYAVGFNDPSYFTKCFKKQFGSAPSEYQNP